MYFFFFFQAEDGIRDYKVTGVQTCALPILMRTSGLDFTATRFRESVREWFSAGAFLLPAGGGAGRSGAGPRRATRSSPPAEDRSAAATGRSVVRAQRIATRRRPAARTLRV